MSHFFFENWYSMNVSTFKIPSGIQANTETKFKHSRIKEYNKQ